MPIDQAFVQWLTRNGYHPRSPTGHSDFLSHEIIKDLLDACPLLAQRAQTGAVVVKLHHSQQVGFAKWDIDIAFGTCAGAPQPPPPGERGRFTSPAIIQIGIELKSIMTEHGKARKNRYRDFEAFHGHGHMYSPDTITAAFLAVNSSHCFASQLNEGKQARKPITYHDTTLVDARATAKSAIDLFRAISLRNSPKDGPGLEAIGVIAVEHDNILSLKNPSPYIHLHQPTIVSPISLPVGDPLHYATMLQRICSLYGQRFP